MSQTLTIEKKRLDYIDIAKALGMLTIMWGHIASNKSVVFVYAFHIPLFFFLSGMVFVQDKYPNFLSFLKRRIQTLIVPYIIYSFITWAIWAAFSYVSHANVESYWMPLVETFIAQGSEGYLVHNVPLWFVSCLFVVELVYYWVAKLTDIWNLIVCVLLAVLGYVLVNYFEFFDFTTLPWSIEVAMSAMVFYATGHLFIKHIGHKKFEQSVNKNRWVSFLIILAMFVVVYYGALFNGRVSMGHADINNPFIFYPIAYLGVFAFIILSSLIAQSKANDYKWMNGVKWFGQNSFIAMVIHNPIKGFVLVVLTSVLGMKKPSDNYGTLTALLALLITLVATIVIMWIIVTIKERKLKKNEHSNF